MIVDKPRVSKCLLYSVMVGMLISGAVQKPWSKIQEVPVSHKIKILTQANSQEFLNNPFLFTLCGATCGATRGPVEPPTRPGLALR